MSNTTNVFASPSNQVAANYLTKFCARLNAFRDWKALEQPCVDARLLAAYKGFPKFDSGSESVEETRKIWVDFLNSDDSPSDIVTRYHSKGLAVFDSVKSEFADTVKNAARKLLETEFALYQAYRQFKSAKLQDESVSAALDSDRTWGKIMRDELGHAQYIELVSCPIWQVIFPDA